MLLTTVCRIWKKGRCYDEMNANCCVQGSSYVFHRLNCNLFVACSIFAREKFPHCAAQYADALAKQPSIGRQLKRSNYSQAIHGIKSK